MKGRTTVLTTALATTLILAAGTAQAQEAALSGGDGWIHVRVEEAGEKTVEIDLPLSLVDVMLEAEGGEKLDAELRLGSGDDVPVEGLRRAWRELRDAGDAEFVNVRDGDERVRLYRRGDRVHLDVDEAGEETVRVEMPAAIVDALLGSEGDRLDLAAAARELGRTADGEIVRVDDGETRVRIWVDRRSAGAEAAGT